jgi:hypothetical protein
MFKIQIITPVRDTIFVSDRQTFALVVNEDASQRSFVRITIKNKKPLIESVTLFADGNKVKTLGQLVAETNTTKDEVFKKNKALNPFIDSDLNLVLHQTPNLTYTPGLIQLPALLAVCEDWALVEGEAFNGLSPEHDLILKERGIKVYDLSKKFKGSYIEKWWYIPHKTCGRVPSLIDDGDEDGVSLKIKFRRQSRKHLDLF